jgi:hypothetical protein
MKSFRFFTFAVAAVLSVAPAALGADFGVRAGWFNDIGDEFVGAEIEIVLGQKISLIPNIEYVLDSDGDGGRLSADLVYNFRNASDFGHHHAAAETIARSFRRWTNARMTR